MTINNMTTTLSKKRKKIDIERQEQQEGKLIPSCSICIQEYSNRTWLRPCYHSFCFTCIKHWINIANSICPICRQQVNSLVYNIDDEENTFDEYHLKDKGNNKLHDPPLHNKKKFNTPEERLKIERTQIYKGLVHAIKYPDPLPKHESFTIITPDYIPRTRVFLQNELKAILDSVQDNEFLENHFIKILLIPYQTKLKQMNDETVILKLAEWLDDDQQLANRLLNELIAYLKSGLAYKHFISSAMYK